MSYDHYKPPTGSIDFDFEEAEQRLKDREQVLRRKELSAPTTLVTPAEQPMETAKISSIPHVNLSKSKVVVPSPVKAELKVQKAVIYRETERESDDEEEVPQNKVQTRGEFRRTRDEELKRKQKEATTNNYWTIGIILAGAIAGFYVAKNYGGNKKNDKASESSEPKLYI
jgi:hypothetical protein